MYRRKKTGDGSILFPALQCWNPETKVITFIAEINGSRIDCKIKLSDLDEKFPICSDDPMQSININRRVLEKIARMKIEQKRFENNGSITISYQDLEVIA